MIEAAIWFATGFCAALCVVLAVIQLSKPPKCIHCGKEQL